jgi:predicted HAD superfamily Cof-like phosphohydrolase
VNKKKRLIVPGKWFTILKPDEIKNHNRIRAEEIIEYWSSYERTDQEDLTELIAEGFQCVENICTKNKRKGVQQDHSPAVPSVCS